MLPHLLKARVGLHSEYPGTGRGRIWSRCGSRARAALELQRIGGDAPWRPARGPMTIPLSRARPTGVATGDRPQNSRPYPPGSQT